MQPTPQPNPQRQAVDDQRITAIDILNPSVVLMDSDQSIKVVLSRNTLIEPQGIQLRGTRLITIPLGWRLLLLRVASRFFKVRLPDEREFCLLHVNTSKSPSPMYADDAVIGHIKNPTTLIHLTGTEYKSLFQMNGRTLHCWVVDRFGLGLHQTVKGRRAA